MIFGRRFQAAPAHALPRLPKAPRTRTRRPAPVPRPPLPCCSVDALAAQENRGLPRAESVPQVRQRRTWTATATRARADSGCRADPLLIPRDPLQSTARPRGSRPGAAFLPTALCSRAVTHAPRPPATPASRHSRPRTPPPSVGEASRLPAGRGGRGGRHFRDHVTERDPRSCRARLLSLAPALLACP